MSVEGIERLSLNDMKASLNGLIIDEMKLIY